MPAALWGRLLTGGGLLTRPSQPAGEAEGEHQFRLLVDTMPQLAWMANADGHIFWYNRRWYEFTNTTPEQMEGWGWQSVHHPDELPNVLERWRASISTGEPFEMEFPLRGGDGVFKWFLTRITPVLDPEGNGRRWFGTSTDVTEIRRESTARVRAGNQRYRVLIENIQDYAILMLDTQGNVVSWSSSAERIKGYSAAEIIGRHFSCFYPPEEIKNGLPAQALRTAALVGHFEHQGPRVRKDGSHFWARVMLTALRDDAGELIGFSKMTRDVSESKQADEELKRQTARLEEQAALLNLAHDAIFVRQAGMTSRITFWNAGAAELYGWKVEEALGHSSHELLNTVFPQPLDEIETELYRNGNWEGELIRTRSDGSIITVESRWALQRDGLGQPVATMEINRDITSQKSAEEALRNVHERLSLALKGGRIGTWTWDAVTDVLSCDDHLAVLFGLSSAEVVASVDHWASLIHPEDQAYVRTQLAVGLETGHYDAEFRIPGADGTLRFIATHGETTFAKGSPVRLTGVCWDITERKRCEAELRSKAAEMERFAYTVSHDLTSPLITIKSFVAMIDQDLAEGSVDHARSDLQRVARAADKMKLLLEDVLTFSRVGRVVGPRETVPSKAMVEEALELVAGRIQNRHIQVEVAPDLPTVTVDRQRLVEVLQNLIDNAAKFMGGQADPRILIGCTNNGAENCFFVKDNGAGIDARYHERIFGLFEKLGPKSEGSGAGLALVKRIVELHGGKIWMESGGAGAGSTFWFTLKHADCFKGENQ